MPTAAPSPNCVRYAHVRIPGTLSGVQPEVQTFTLTTADGATVPGWQGDARTAAGLGRFVGEPVVVIGVGRFDRAGKLLCVAASAVTPAGSRPALTAAERRLVVRRLLEGLGTGPGDDEGR